jgi:hypothetical protein
MVIFKRIIIFYLKESDVKLECVDDEVCHLAIKSYALFGQVYFQNENKPFHFVKNPPFLECW